MSITSSSSYQTTKSYETPDKQLFIKSIRDFKKINKIKLKNLFQFDDKKMLPLRKKLWSKPEIKNYISRNSECVNFTKYHPILNTDRKEKLKNDYYESRLYQLASEQSWEVFPYRNLAKKDDFYLDGTISFNGIRDNPSIRRRTCTALSRLIELNNKNDICITQEEDVYKIRKRLLALQHLKTNNARFILSFNHTGGHATLLVSVLEKGTDRLLVTIYIDSQDSDNYKVHRVFNRPEEWHDIWRPHPMDPNKNNARVTEIYEKIKKELGGKSIKIDSAKKTAFLLDESYAWYHDNENCKRISKAEESHTVDVIHNLVDDIDDGIDYRVFDRRQVTIINASNVLQTARDDKSCALYTFNTLQAVVKLLEKKENSEKVYRHALNIAHGKESKKQVSQKAMQTIFREDIKPLLPCYFNNNGKPKSESELKEFHLKQRWQLGSLAASNEDYLRYKGFA
jgi:hypothetical protein